MIFELARSLRALTSPLTAALHEAHKMTRPFHFEQGGTVPTKCEADDPNNKDAFVVPPDIREQEVRSAIQDQLRAKRYSMPHCNSSVASSLKRTVDGRVFVPADVVLLLGDGSIDRGRRVMERRL
jgi:hypothetical protein